MDFFPPLDSRHATGVRFCPIRTENERVHARESGESRERYCSVTYHGIDIASDRIAGFCRTHGIRRLSLFGSILREDFGPDSDIDFLVEFEPGKVPSLLGMAALEIALSEMLGRPVDLRTPEDLSRYFREDVIQSAEVQYAAET